MKSFLNGKPFVIDQKHIDRRKPKCSLCGVHFKEGDQVRFVYANGTPGAQCGNFFVCDQCDGPDALDRGIESFRQAMKLATQWGLYQPWEMK